MAARWPRCALRCGCARARYERVSATRRGRAGRRHGRDRPENGGAVPEQMFVGDVTLGDLPIGIREDGLPASTFRP